jgi:hypothetical protein
MKQLLYILLFSSFQLSAQAVATITLADGTFINNAPSGKDWTAYNTVPGGIVLYAEKDTLIIDDSDIGKMTYYGNWRISTSGLFTAGDSSCNCSWSQSPNDSLVFKFTNTRRFEWYGEKMLHQGIVDLYWEDQFMATIDTYSPNNLSLYRHWFIDDLDTAKVYKFKIVATGNKNAASTGTSAVNRMFFLINTKPKDENNPVTLNGITILASGYQNQPPNYVYPPSNIFDNNLTTKWAAKGIGHWILFEYSEEQVIQSVGVSFSIGDRNDIFDLYVGSDTSSMIKVLERQIGLLGTEIGTYDFHDIQGRFVKYVALGNVQNTTNWNSISEIIIDCVPISDLPPIIPPGVPIPVDTVRVLDLVFSIIREGRFQVYIGDSLDIGEHNEYEKAIEHALKSKTLNPDKKVIIKSPIRRVELN